MNYSRISNIFYDQIEPDEVVAGCINIYKNIISDSNALVELIDRESLENNDFNWSRATTLGEGTNQNKRTNYDLSLTNLALNYNNSLSKNIHNIVQDSLNKTLPLYSSMYGIQNLYINEGFNLLRYESGQKYDEHFDGYTYTGRSVSAIIYLNEDFDGGETEFVNFGIKIKPSAGSMILFPSSYPYSHFAHPVFNGSKYAIVTWIHDRE